AVSTPGSSLSMGSRTPMSPVEQTAISAAPVPRTSAAFSAVAWVSWKPLGPVQALAPPELRTTAVNFPLLRTCSDQSTGAALTRLEVKTPAAARRGPLLTTRARSGFPFSLIPAAMPAAVNPLAAVTLTASPRSLLRPRGAAVRWSSAARRPPSRRSRGDPGGRQPGGLVEAEGDVHALHGTSRGALGQVVDGADGDDPSRGLVEGDLHLDGVGAVHRRRRRPLARGEQADERLVGVGLLVGGAHRVGGRAPAGRGAAGGEDAAGHGGEGRSEGDGDRLARRGAEVLDHLGGVPVDAADAVGRHGAHNLAAQQMRLG